MLTFLFPKSVFSYPFLVGSIIIFFEKYFFSLPSLSNWSALCAGTILIFLEKYFWSLLIGNLLLIRSLAPFSDITFFLVSIMTFFEILLTDSLTLSSSPLTPGFTFTFLYMLLLLLLPALSFPFFLSTISFLDKLLADSVILSSSSLLLGFFWTLLWYFLVVPSIDLLDKWLDSLIISGSSLFLGFRLFFSFFFISLISTLEVLLIASLELSSSPLTLTFTFLDILLLLLLSALPFPFFYLVNMLKHCYLFPTYHLQ